MIKLSTGISLLLAAGLMVGSAMPAASSAAAQSVGGKPKAGQTRLDPEQAIERARKALAAGRTEEALKVAEQVLQSTPRDSRNTARALAVRGEARLKLGRIAEAMADLDNALWVKGGLAGAERATATAARTEAYGLAGIGPGTGSGQTAARDVARDAARDAARAGRATSSEATSAGATSATGGGGLGGVGRFFSSLFGTSSGGSAAASGDPATTAALAPTAQPLAATSSYAPVRGESAALGAAGAAGSPPLPVRPSARPVTAGGQGYHLQLAAVKTKAEAQALGETARKQHPDVLTGLKFEVKEAVFGNMGRFYRVRIGPFTNAVESKAICASLRNRGHDCMVVTR